MILTRFTANKFALTFWDFSLQFTKKNLIVLLVSIFFLVSQTTVIQQTHNILLTFPDFSQAACIMATDNYFSWIIDKHQHTHFFTFKTVLV